MAITLDGRLSSRVLREQFFSIPVSRSRSRRKNDCSRSWIPVPVKIFLFPFSRSRSRKPFEIPIPVSLFEFKKKYHHYILASRDIILCASIPDFNLKIKIHTLHGRGIKMLGNYAWCMMIYSVFLKNTRFCYEIQFLSFIEK